MVMGRSWLKWIDRVLIGKNIFIICYLGVVFGRGFLYVVIFKFLDGLVGDYIIKGSSLGEFIGGFVSGWVKVNV